MAASDVEVLVVCTVLQKSLKTPKSDLFFWISQNYPAQTKATPLQFNIIVSGKKGGWKTIFSYLGPGNFSGVFPGHERPRDQAFRFTKERGSLPFCYLADAIGCCWGMLPIPSIGLVYIYIYIHLT